MASRLGAAYLGEVPLAVNSIALTLACLFWQTPLALCQASSIRIGNLLGANLPHSAKRASEAAQIYTFVITGITAILIQVLRRHFAQLFSRDPLVLGLFDRMVRTVSPTRNATSMLTVLLGMACSSGCILRWHSRRLYWNVEGRWSALCRFPLQSLQLLVGWSAYWCSRDAKDTKARRSLDRYGGCCLLYL